VSTLSRVIYDPDTTPPSTPSIVTATALSQTVIRITWSASTDTGGSGLAGYRVFHSTTSGGTYTQVGTDLSVASLTYDDAGLLAGSTHYYRVFAFDGNGNISSQSATASATTQASNPNTGLSWPAHSPGYLSLLPNVGGYGMQTVAGSGRHLGTPATTVILINSLASGNSGGALTGLGANVFGGTFEYAWRHAASPKVIIPIVSGWVQIQDSIPCQTGTPPRPGYVSYYGQGAPNPGLFLRGANIASNGASDLAVWHLRSYMGDDVAGLGAGARDCFSSGYGAGTTQRVVLINCDFAWSVDEIDDFNRSHSEITCVNCAFVEPLHLSTIVHPEDGPGVDHGFGPIIGGDTGQVQTEAVSTFRNLWAHTTARNPLVSARTFVHANNLHYNHGRPGTGQGNAVQIISAGAAVANVANILGNGFIRGPNNSASFVAISVTGTFPSGSAGYSFANAQFGWTAPANQNAFFTSSPSGYVSSSLQTGAFPGSWGSIAAVLQWAANPLAPTAAEWSGYVDLMESTVGAQPRWRTASIGRVKTVFDQIRNCLNGGAQSNQFVDTVTQAGGWFSVANVTIDPLNPGTHWHAPLPTGSNRDTPYTSGTFSDGTSKVGYTRLEEWAYEQHLFVMVVDVLSPTVPANVQAASQSQTTIRITWDASTDAGGSGLAGYRVFRSTTSGGTYTQIGGDLAASTLSYDDTTLSLGQQRFYRVLAFDGRGNASGLSAIVSATTQSSSGNDGLIVTNFASYDPDAAQIISLDINSTIPNWGTTAGANITFANETWWSGTAPVATMFPPTSERASGFGAIPFWKSATKAVRQLNFRLEFRLSDLYCSDSTGLPKFFIFRCADALSISAPLNWRPMIFLAHGNQDANLGAPNSINFTPAIGTLRTFDDRNRVPAPNTNDRIASGDSTPGTHCIVPQPLYVAASAGTDSGGNPIIDADEYLCMEIRLQMMVTSDEPQGFVGYRITRRNSAIAPIERGCALTWDANYPLNTLYIADIDCCGGGYYNLGNSGSASLWTKAGRRFTIGTNIQPSLGRAWIGPPTGFVQ
jgi:hypothetical protein